MFAEWSIILVGPSNWHKVSHERLTLPLYAELTPSCLYRGSAVRAKETNTTTDSINQVLNPKVKRSK